MTSTEPSAATDDAPDKVSIFATNGDTPAVRPRPVRVKAKVATGENPVVVVADPSANPSDDELWAATLAEAAASAETAARTTSPDEGRENGDHRETADPDFDPDFDAEPDQTAAVDIRAEELSVDVRDIDEDFLNTALIDDLADDEFVVVNIGGGRKPRGKLKARKVRRIVRYVSPWSVFKVALLFNFCMWVVFTIASVILWQVAVQSGQVSNLEKFLAKLLAESSYTINGRDLFRALSSAGVVMVFAGTGFLVLMSLLFNVICDITGGVRFTVLELESTRREIKTRQPDTVLARVDAGHYDGPQGRREGRQAKRNNRLERRAR